MRAYIALLLGLIGAQLTHASEDTIGAGGINSRAIGLTGNGIAIGQVELGRPGKPSKDMPKYVHPQVQPTEVYAGSVVDDANSSFVTDPFEGVHATQVAGVMIAKPTPLASVEGVAPDADLYSVADGLSDDDITAIITDRLADLPVNVRAINLSYGRELQPIIENTDGNAHWTQFIDWSAQSGVHDVLYVAGGSEDPRVDIPQDHFNGITVAASQRLDGLNAGPYREVSPLNDTVADAEPGARTTIDLLAPGFQVLLAAPSQLDTDLDGVEVADSGTSLAAPHVTGTVALLQQHANTRIGEAAPRWNENAQRHEVMKAILLNSADKDLSRN